MANRTFTQFSGTLQKGVVTLFAKVTFDAGGVPTLVTSEVINAGSSPVTINPSNGFASVSQLGSGAYEFFLQDPYVRMLAFTGIKTDAGGAIVLPVIVGDSLVNDQTAPKLLVQFGTPDVGGGFAPTDPDSTTMLFSVSLANSTAL
jgi:hypothetical protein